MASRAFLFLLFFFLRQASDFFAFAFSLFLFRCRFGFVVFFFAGGCLALSVFVWLRRRGEFVIRLCAFPRVPSESFAFALFFFAQFTTHDRPDDSGAEQRENNPEPQARHVTTDGPPMRLRRLSAASEICAARFRSRRRMAFSFPPRSKSRQVRYIHVSNTMSDASAGKSG
jgi:hypothetical protein